MRRRLVLQLGGASLLAACSPSLAAFDAIAPRDGGVRRVVRNAAYGPHARQKLDVYAPRQVEGRLPVIIFIYGGSWRSGSKDDYQFLGAALAAQGFLVLIPDYRLVPEVRFPAFVDDCALAAKWAVDNAADYGGDVHKLVIAGHSAGAYNAVMLGLDARFLSRAGVASSVVRGVVGLAGPYDFLPFDVDATRDAFGDAPDPLATQPITFARRDAPPMLLLWGEEDTTVGRRNIEGLTQAMRAAGGNVEAKTYPGVDHVAIMLALSRPFRGRAPVLQDVTAFARRNTT